jgi:hypothetical protein
LWIVVLEGSIGATRRINGATLAQQVFHKGPEGATIALSSACGLALSAIHRNAEDHDTTTEFEIRNVLISKEESPGEKEKRQCTRTRKEQKQPDKEGRNEGTV